MTKVVREIDINELLRCHARYEAEQHCSKAHSYRVGSCVACERDSALADLALLAAHGITVAIGENGREVRIEKRASP